MDMGEQGVRVNALSAGPLKTLAASGVGDFRKLMHWNAINSALERNITQEEVGMAALGLLSGCGACITGEVVHADCGYHIQGMVRMKNVKENIELLSEI